MMLFFPNATGFPQAPSPSLIASIMLDGFMASHGEHEQATHKQQVSKDLSHLSHYTRWLIWILTMAYHKPRHIVSYA